MSDKTYDRLKYVALIFIPAFEALILTVGKIWAIPYYSEIGATIAAVGVFLGALLNVSSQNYWKEVNDDDAGTGREETEEEDS